MGTHHCTERASLASYLSTWARFVGRLAPYSNRSSQHPASLLASVCTACSYSLGRSSFPGCGRATAFACEVMICWWAEESMAERLCYQRALPITKLAFIKEQAAFVVCIENPIDNSASLSRLTIDFQASIEWNHYWTVVLLLEDYLRVLKFSVTWGAHWIVLVFA